MMIRIMISSLLIAICTLHAETMYIAKPVVSLWTDPINDQPQQTAPYFSKELPHHDSQLLYGEFVEVIEKINSQWLHVSATNQLIRDKGTLQWHPLQGYIESSSVAPLCDFEGAEYYGLVTIQKPWVTVFDSPSHHAMKLIQLPFGSILRTNLGQELQKGIDDKNWAVVYLLDGQQGYVQEEAISPLRIVDFDDTDQLKAIRQSLVIYALLFQNNPYCWGGRSPYDKASNEQQHTITSVDCSGLVQLIYQVALFGINKSTDHLIRIPRNAQDQYIMSEPIDPSIMQPGDLMFFKSKKSDFKKVVHVLMYLGDNQFIEATGSQSKPEKNIVRIISTPNYMGIELKNLKNGMHAGRGDAEVELSFGSLVDGIDVFGI